MQSLIVLGLFPLFSASPVIPYFSPFPIAPFHAHAQRPPVFSLYDSQGLGLQVRGMADSLTSTLRSLAQDPSAAQIIKRVLGSNNVCLSNMEEAIQAIQEGTRLVEAAEGDLLALNKQVEALMGLRDEAEVVRKVASIFRTLQPLLRKVSPANPSSKICSTSTDRTDAYLRSLVVMLEEFSHQFPQNRGVFAESATILSTVNSFLRQLKVQTKEFQNFCFPDKESSARGIRAMGQIISSLADMFAVLGNVNTSEEIRKGNRITETIVVRPYMNNYFDSIWF